MRVEKEPPMISSSGYKGKVLLQRVFISTLSLLPSTMINHLQAGESLISGARRESVKPKSEIRMLKATRTLRHVCLVKKMNITWFDVLVFATRLEQVNLEHAGARTVCFCYHLSLEVEVGIDQVGNCIYLAYNLLLF